MEGKCHDPSAMGTWHHDGVSTEIEGDDYKTQYKHTLSALGKPQKGKAVTDRLSPDGGDKEVPELEQPQADVMCVVCDALNGCRIIRRLCHCIKKRGRYPFRLKV
jgi:hypothetical protein